MCKLAGLPFEYAPRQGEVMRILLTAPGGRYAELLRAEEEVVLNYIDLPAGRYKLKVVVFAGGEGSPEETEISVDLESQAIQLVDHAA